jgi:hypothetical protein
LIAFCRAIAAAGLCAELYPSFICGFPLRVSDCIPRKGWSEEAEEEEEVVWLWWLRRRRRLVAKEGTE